jgi:DNA-binding winged helix-turn-helix (wHTH) protein
VTYRFARFAVNGETRQLLADGREIHVSPKAFELLLRLIEQRSRALSKAELQEQLWPSTFVGETNLPTLVAEIRRALGDSAQDSSYVRTMHRFGYRFVADVAEAATPRVVSSKASSMYLTSADRRYLLSEGATVIGRAHDAAIRIDSGGVSRHHARVLVQGTHAQVEDLGSKNGTFVAGELVIAPRVLADGEEVRVGSAVLTFKVAPPTQATESMD